VSKENDLREVMEEEKRRGRRQPKSAQMQFRMRRLLKIWPTLIDEADEATVRAVLIEFGFEENSPAYERALRLWRAGWKP